MHIPIDVVGIGADGWSGLTEPARAMVSAADVVFGSSRQLQSLPIPARKQKIWPKPLLPNLRSSIEGVGDARICVLGSGDPMFHGIGVTLVREFGPALLHVIPAPSSLSLACARLGWPVHTTTTVSLVTGPGSTLLPALSAGANVLVLSRDRFTPEQVSAVLRDNGFGGSTMTVLEQLGGPAERSISATADQWAAPAGDSLNVVAIECVLVPSRIRSTRVPGLPDSLYAGDGQLTKTEVRALTLSALAPAPGELLWDVGGGSGSIAIEWMRTDSRCRAVIFETNEHRRTQIETNASALGVPGVVIRGRAPDGFAVDGAPDAALPDAIFIGGGLTEDSMIDACWDVLGSGGRLVANAVTAESEALLLSSVARFGGALRKFQIYRGEPLGSFTSWRPHLPVAQWIAVKP